MDAKGAAIMAPASARAKATFFMAEDLRENVRAEISGFRPASWDLGALPDLTVKKKKAGYFLPTVEVTYSPFTNRWRAS